MALAPGNRVGPYEIVAPIGAGGMGEVFRARDTRLQRDVALKILPELFAQDPERLVRFEREAQMLASLNCQNIAGIFGLEESASGKALVLELVEGPTLADRIAAGPLPLDEAVAIARQIVDALDAAHTQGIIHRDLKPANIKVRPDGTVKVLDFGIAKALDPGTGAAVDPLNSPTITGPATQMGVILGTAAYMAPEQARGKSVDKRADIWAFGCVLYEMLTGRSAFAGEDVSDTLAFVITREPDWSALPASVPMPLCRLLRRCLEKDRKRRLADIADARLELDEALTSGADTPSVGTIAPRPNAWRSALPWALATGIAVALVAVVAMWAPWRASPHTARRFSVHIGADVTLAITGTGASYGSSVALSPRGDTLVFVARAERSRPSMLWVRRLDQLAAVPLNGTVGASSPMIAPDGQSVAFFAGGQLKRISIAGGAAATLAPAPFPRGGDWFDDQTIVFAPDRATPIMRVSAAGGQPEPITSLGPDEATHRRPQGLPGGKALLYTAHSSTSGFDTANIVVKPLPDGAPRVVLQGGYNARYAGSGHLLFIREGSLYAVAFDLDRLETSGTPMVVAEGVSSVALAGAAHVDIAGDGTLVYVEGREAEHTGQIFWLNREGTRTDLRATPSTTINLNFSPDGRKLALDTYDGRQWDVSILDWNRDTLTPLTDATANEQRPVWTPDGRRIAYGSSRGEGNRLIYNLYWRRADGVGEAQRLTTSRSGQRATSFHPSGRYLALAELTPATSWDILVLPIDGDEANGWKPGTPQVFVNERATELEPAFSPDGQWIAYQSNVSGRDEVYVRGFPGPGGREQISSAGGSHPVWSRTARELLFLGEGKIMVAPFTVKDGVFYPERPRPWSQGAFTPRSGPVGRAFDLHPDGSRMAFAALSDEEAAGGPDRIVLISNFFDELRRLAPTGR